jgi:hypothetical protein
MIGATARIDTNYGGVAQGMQILLLITLPAMPCAWLLPNPTAVAHIIRLAIVDIR